MTEPHPPATPRELKRMALLAALGPIVLSTTPLLAKLLGLF